jgi:hypothetical protein
MKYLQFTSGKNGYAQVRVVEFTTGVPFTCSREQRVRPANTKRDFHHPPGDETATPMQIHIIEILDGE